MPDKSAENLARIRACDADWNENDHPRADNGQFTSGSGGGGAKVSKLQSGGKAKVQQRPKIQAMRQLAKAAAGGATESETYKNSYKHAQEHFADFESDFDFDPGSEEFEADYADAQEKLKKWNKFLAKNPTDETSRRQVGWYQGLVDAYKAKVDKANTNKAAKEAIFRQAAAAKPQPKAAKNNGGLESYKYKPPSKLEGFPIVMASKKTNSGLGGGNRFKFGFKKYKDGIMIRYVDDYWDSSDYAFVPLKNPTLENAYSYSDNASSKTVSALKDSLVTNEELGKIARQLK